MYIKLFDHQLCMTLHTATKPIINVYSSSKYWIFHSNNVAFTSIVRTGQNAALGSSNTEEKDIIFELSISEIAVKSFWMSIILKNLQTAVPYLTVSQFPISCTQSPNTHFLCLNFSTKSGIAAIPNLFISVHMYQVPRKTSDWRISRQQVFTKNPYLGNIQSHSKTR